jgi:hypothetical protein
MTGKLSPTQSHRIDIQKSTFVLKRRFKRQINCATPETSMDLAFTPEAQAFREGIRAWVHTNPAFPARLMPNWRSWT